MWSAGPGSDTWCEWTLPDSGQRLPTTDELRDAIHSAVRDGADVGARSSSPAALPPARSPEPSPPILASDAVRTTQPGIGPVEAPPRCQAEACESMVIVPSARTPADAPEPEDAPEPQEEDDDDEATRVPHEPWFGRSGIVPLAVASALALGGLGGFALRASLAPVDARPVATSAPAPPAAPAAPPAITITLPTADRTAAPSSGTRTSAAARAPVPASARPAAVHPTPPARPAAVPPPGPEAEFGF
jgi:hypothetical protein